MRSLRSLRWLADILFPIALVPPPLLAGMAFQSGVAEVGSGPHLALTWLVAIVLVVCIALFLGMLAVEVWRSARFANRQASARKSSAAAPVGSVAMHVARCSLVACCACGGPPR